MRFCVLKSVYEEISKSRGYGIGTVRIWKGKRYKKTAPDKWSRIYENKHSTSQFLSKSPNARLVADINANEKAEISNGLKQTIGTVKHGIIAKTDTESVMTVAKKYVDEHFKVPAETKIGKIAISKKGMKDSLSHGFNADKIDAIPAIKDVLEKGVYIGYEHDINGKPVNNHYFAGRVCFPQADKIVFCRVHENKGDSINKFYVHEVFTEDDIKNERDSLQDRATPTVGKHGGIPLIQSILQDVLSVKQKKDINKSFREVVNFYLNRKGA